MSSNPLVSIIITTQDTLDYLKFCVESIYASKTNIPFELIIFDNGSEKETIKYLNGLNCKVILGKNNIGVPKAKNKAFNVISERSKFACFLDNDVAFGDYWLDDFVKLFKSDPKIGIAGPSMNIRVFYDNLFKNNMRTQWFNFSKKYGYLKPKVQIENFYLGKFKFFVESQRQNKKRKVYELKTPPDYLPGSCQFFRVSAVKDMKELYDENYPFFNASDVDFCWKIGKSGYKVVYTEKIYIHHFKGKSDIANKPKELYLDSMKGHARLCIKWSKEIINYLSKPQVDKVITPFMSGSLIDSFVSNYRFFKNSKSGKWELNNSIIKKYNKAYY